MHTCRYKRFFKEFQKQQQVHHANIGYGVSSLGIQKLERFLPKNQHFQMKLLNFKNWCNGQLHGLRTPNEGINQRCLKNWADVADKICFNYRVNFQCQLMLQAFLYLRGFDFCDFLFTPVYYSSATLYYYVTSIYMVFASVVFLVSPHVKSVQLKIAQL